MSSYKDSVILDEGVGSCDILILCKQNNVVEETQHGSKTQLSEALAEALKVMKPVS